MSIFTSIVRALGFAPQLDAVEAVEKAVGAVASNPTPENVETAVGAAATATAAVSQAVATTNVKTVAAAAAPVAIADASSLLSTALTNYLTEHYGEVGTIGADVVLGAAQGLEEALAPKPAAS